VTPIAVIDATPLINLTHLDLAMKLSQFFTFIYIPREVETEASRKKRRRRKLAKLFRSGVFRKCVVSDSTGIESLTRDKRLDRGEAEALVQTQEQRALFFIGDEPLAREIAANMGRRVIGTAAILARLNLIGLAGDPRLLINELRKAENFYITEEVLGQAIESASTPLL
jgi:predicted nucleic acid-binding protein